MDEPEFCTTWSFYPDWTVDDLRRYLGSAVEVINHALRGLPEDQIRFHTCWGSGHRPHVTDIELKYFADLILKINARQYAIEAANVRHEHEYHVWEDVKLPAGKMLMPGVISHATDLVEHPELVAERIENYARLVGRENVQTGTDCGIGSRVGHEEIVWAKLKAMSDGAAIASKRLWGQVSTAAVPERTGFAAQLRRLRLRAGLTQEALAEKAGVSVATIGAIEEGQRRRPYPHTLRALADSLELSATDRAALMSASGPATDEAKGAARAAGAADGAHRSRT